MFTLSEFIGLICIAFPWLSSTTFGPSPAVAAFMGSWMAFAGWLLFSPVSRNTNSVVNISKWVAGAWLLAALCSAAIGLVQFSGYSPSLSPWINVTVPGEAFGNLRQRNHFATLMNIGLAALLWYQTTTTRPGLVRSLPLPTAALIALGNAASSSRTGLLQLVLLIGLVWVWTCCEPQESVRVMIRRTLGVALIAYSFGVMFLPTLAGLDPHTSGILARLHHGDSVCASRLTLWSNVLHLIAQKPWLGWGWGELDYAHFITLYPGARFCDILDNAHNLPLHLAVELGVPVAVVVCAVGCWLIWRAKPWRETDATRQLAWSVLALIGLHSLLEYPLWYGPFQIAAGLSLYMLVRTPTEGADHLAVPPSPSKPWAHAFSASVALVLMLICAYSAWDYHRISQIYLPPAERDSAYRENTMEKIQNSWLFKNQVRFAELTTTPLTRENAEHMFALAQELLHFSPESRVVQILINSAALLGREAEAQYYQARFNAAFP